MRMKNQSSLRLGINYHIGSNQNQQKKKDDSGENGSTKTEETLGSIKDDTLAECGKEMIFPT